MPVHPGKRYIDWNLPDPGGRSLDEVRVTRDDIQQVVTTLVAELDAAYPFATAPSVAAHDYSPESYIRWRFPVPDRT